MTQTREILFELTGPDRERARYLLWEEMRHRAEQCKACPLYATRTQLVYGEGNRESSLVFIGEGPGGDEDLQGRPFVGRSGQLLTQILQAAGIERKDVYIGNVVKCRPPGNRQPTTEEMFACDAHLQAQLLMIKPALMVMLGNTPTRWILKTTEPIGKLRGRWFDWRGVAVMPMFHPSYLLRYPDSKAGSPKHLAWLDIQEVKRAWDLYRKTGSLEGIKIE